MTNKKMNVCLVVGTGAVAAWKAKTIEGLINDGHCNIFLAHCDLPCPSTSKPSRFRRLLDKLYSVFIERHAYVANACAPVDVQSKLQSYPLLDLGFTQQEADLTFSHHGQAQLKENSIDVVISLVAAPLSREIVKEVSCGLWELRFGETLEVEGTLSGYWEAIERTPQTASALLIRFADPQRDVIAKQSYSSTDLNSVQDNRSNCLWKTAAFIPRAVRELAVTGQQRFFKGTLPAQTALVDRAVKSSPDSTAFLGIFIRKFFLKIQTLVNNRLRFKQWILLFKFGDADDLSLASFTRLTPPKESFWADPHVFVYNGNYYIFIEEYPFSTAKGIISVITVDQAGNCSQPEKVLERPYHLSYPNVFEIDGKIYMIPESADNNTVELYECIEFPGKWQFKQNLLEGIKAFDVTLLEEGGKWWLFANVVEKGLAMSSWDELHLYSSDDLFSGNWTPHPRNPVVSDCRYARPAGKIFRQNGRIIRPSQNSSHHYGYGLNFVEIVVLNEHEYQERLISQIEPKWDDDIIGIHSYSKEQALTVVDGILVRKRK